MHTLTGDHTSDCRRDGCQEEKADNKEQWLQENGYGDADVMVDPDGREYVIYETENGNPGEDGYGIHKDRIYLDDVLSG